ncbi:hypothetical protein KBA39_08230 [Myxococcota bacterium]|nr:hypothetical protein [Myxococcota bacterium]
MRLWSLHPRHLDAKGLVACWREGLLAQAVLSGRAKGYTRHPQLDRFRAATDPLIAIDCFLSRILDEAMARGYRFDRTKIRYCPCACVGMTVTDGQIAFEWAHLRDKLRERDPARFTAWRRTTPDASPCFHVVAGGVEPWERGAARDRRSD